MSDRVRADLIEVIQNNEVDNLSKTQEIFEEEVIRFALKTSKSYKDAAINLGIGKSTMYRKMKKYGIPKKRAH